MKEVGPRTQTRINGHEQSEGKHNHNQELNRGEPGTRSGWMHLNQERDQAS